MERQVLAGGQRLADLTAPLRPLTAAWNGSTWQLQANPGGARQLASVWCTGSRSCMAAGSDLAVHGPHVPAGSLAERWNGSTWKVLRTASPGGLRARLAAVSCAASARCQAVGGFVSQSGSSFLQAQGWNGSRWRLESVPDLSRAFNDFYAVSCSSASGCVAVGVTGAQRPLAEHWDGTRWRTMPVRLP